MQTLQPSRVVVGGLLWTPLQHQLRREKKGMRRTWRNDQDGIIFFGSNEIALNE